MSDAAVPSETAESGETLADLALRRIVRLIRQGELKPGDLVLEADLSKRFGMSRGPIREAIRQLEGRKLVTRQAYQRARVIELDPKQIRSVFEVREALEGMACRLATRRMSDEALEALAEEVKEARTPDRYSFVFTEHPFNFHRTIVAACGNPHIQKTLTNEVYELVRLSRWVSNSLPSGSGPGAKDHWQICRAMIARDEDLAESLMRAHIQRVMRLIKGLD